jgi:nitrogen-specific signal transduction histidine kinase
LRGGTGLGLSIVKQIVDRLGGKVGFADAPGGGTVFNVTLPCWKESDRADDEAAAAIASQPPALVPSVAKKIA